MVKDDLEAISERIEKAEKSLSFKHAMKPIVHPAMASRYQQAINNLKRSLGADETRSEASEYLRGLIDKVVLTPEEGAKGLRIDLFGDLAAILNMSLEARDMNDLNRLCLDASNDNQPINGAEAHIDRIGCGSWI